MNVVASAYFRFFQPVLAFDAESRKRTTLALRAARIRMLPEFYLTMSYLVAAGAAVAALVFASIGVAFLAQVPGFARVLLVIASAVAAFLLVRLAFLGYPRLVASGRARRIDGEFPSVVTLCYALARGGMSILDVFRAVADERETYGEISVEFAFVMREVDHIGKDLNSALQSISSTTPSPQLRAFFDGLVTIMNSGAEPKDYFKRQAETLLQQAELAAERDIEQAGMLGEAYVSGLLVLPLLLIVVLTVLSAIKSTGGGMVHMIVFVVIPGGTVAYLVLVDMMLPSDVLTRVRQRQPKLSDFGSSSIPAQLLVLPPPREPTLEDVAEDIAHEAKGRGHEASTRRRLLLVWAVRRMKTAWQRFVERALEKPIDALNFSGVFATVALVGGGIIVWQLGVRGRDLTVAVTGLLLLTALIAMIPVSIFHEIRVRRARRVDAELPEVLSKLAGFNEKGVSLLRSFQILGRTASGSLGRQFRSLDRDVSWTANLRGALTRLRTRVDTRRMTKLSILFERGIGASGNLKDVLEIAATEASVSEGQRSRKRQAMLSYAIVVYVVFAVFLYVVFVVTDLFYSADSAFAAAATSKSGGFGGGMAAGAAQLLFFHAVLIQAVCCGLVAGRLGENHILSGIKHAAIMVGLAWAVFQVGVL